MRASDEGSDLRRNLVRRAALLAACAACAAAVSPAPAGAVSGSLTRYPYLTDSVQTSVTLNWATTTAGSTGSVVYGPPGSCSGATKGATKTGITVNGVAEYQWKATLPVAPDTAYCYRIRLGSTDLLGADPSPTFVSQVAAGSTAPFSFAVFGDWGQAYAGSANADQANVLRQMAASGSRFAVMTGDTAYPNGSQTNYGDLRQTGTDVSAVFGPAFWAVPGRSLPVFNVPGNHGFFAASTQVTNWPEANAARTSGGRYVIDSYPSIGGSVAGRYPSFWYAFDAGPARFYVLTAAWGDLIGGPAGPYASDRAAHWTPSRAEYRWLAADLAANPRPLKFAFWHYPLYADTVGAPSDTELQGGAGTLQGLLDAHGVDIAFNGHAHGYERNQPDPGGMVSYVFGNGGADLGPVHTCSAFDVYAIGAGGTHCGLAPAGLTDDHVFGFAKVTVSGQQVTVAPTDELGRTYDVQTYTVPDGGQPFVAPPPGAPPPPPPPPAAPAAKRVVKAKACAHRERGNRRANRLRGTRRGDRLVGRSGNDVLEGFGGADCLSGGRGRDVVRGGSGNDRVSGGPGRDRLYGGRGRDYISARDGTRDRVRCGRGRDVARVDRRDRVQGCERVRRARSRRR